MGKLFSFTIPIVVLMVVDFRKTHHSLLHWSKAVEMVFTFSTGFSMDLEHSHF